MKPTLTLLTELETPLKPNQGISLTGDKPAILRTIPFNYPYKGASVTEAHN
jgi:hypothetical protein